MREKGQLVNRKSERANIGIEEADNGGESERDKMEFWRLRGRQWRWSYVCAVLRV